MSVHIHIKCLNRVVINTQEFRDLMVALNDEINNIIRDCEFVDISMSMIDTHFDLIAPIYVNYTDFDDISDAYDRCKKIAKYDKETLLKCDMHPDYICDDYSLSAIHIIYNRRYNDSEYARVNHDSVRQIYDLIKQVTYNHKDSYLIQYECEYDNNQHTVCVSHNACYEHIVNFNNKISNNELDTIKIIDCVSSSDKSELKTQILSAVKKYNHFVKLKNKLKFNV